VRAARLLRDRSGDQRVTNIELFFDLVYVFAVTQLSHYLLHEATLGGVLRMRSFRIGSIMRYPVACLLDEEDPFEIPGPRTCSSIRIWDRQHR